MLNDWNEKEVKRAEATWGHKFPIYTLDMFNFALSSGASFLDLGCGFGRFLQFLTEKKEEPDYIGYDSSKAMIERIHERFPDFLIRTFLRSITLPINHPQEVIISSAIFIHLTLEDQRKILKNILALQPLPRAITFDINCPGELKLDRLKSERTESFERRIKITRGGEATFRMTWQSHYLMTKRILKQFPKYNLTVKFYDLKQGRHKVVYMLNKR